MNVDVNEVNIRSAQREDLQSIYNLVVELAIFEEEPDAVTSTLVDYEEAFDNGLIHAFVAEIANEVVGMALYYVTFSTWKGQNLYLEDFYVKESHRSFGIGQRLFDAYIKKASAMNSKMVKWQVLDWNEKAIKFYKKNNTMIEKCWFDCKIFF